MADNWAQDFESAIAKARDIARSREGERVLVQVAFPEGLVNVFSEPIKGVWAHRERCDG